MVELLYGFTALHLVVFFLTLRILYKHIIHPVLISPLRKVPNAHWSVGFSSWWILWTRYRSRELATIHESHKRHGPVIRLAPNEISVNCVKGGIQTIYAGGFEKHEWYSNLFDNYGIPNMFSTSHSRPHSARKRMLSNIYSKSHLINSLTMNQITKVLITERFIPALGSFAQSGETFDVFSFFSAITMDFVTAYQFGLESNSNFLRDKEQWKQFLGWYDNRQSYNIWPQELPILTKLLRKFSIRLVPSWVDEANNRIQSWTLTMIDKAHDAMSSSKQEDANRPVVYQQLYNALSKEPTVSSKTLDPTVPSPTPLRLTIASEMLDHLAAGFDTSGITLTYFVHEISQRPDLQKRLRQELLLLDPPLTFAEDRIAGEIPSPKLVDELPLLQAMLQETLRLRAAIPGPQPRITPESGCTLGPNGEFAIPGSVRVSAQAHSLHRNPEVFDSPEEWKPERWLQPGSDENLKEMNRWFWAFGSGGRMCVGSNLAIYKMKYIIASIYTNWETVIVDDYGVEQKDIYTAPPKAGKLMIKLDQPMSQRAT